MLTKQYKDKAGPGKPFLAVQFNPNDWETWPEGFHRWNASDCQPRDMSWGWFQMPDYKHHVMYGDYFLLNSESQVIHIMTADTFEWHYEEYKPEPQRMEGLEKIAHEMQSIRPEECEEEDDPILERHMQWWGHASALSKDGKSIYVVFNGAAKKLGFKDGTYLYGKSTGD